MSAFTAGLDSGASARSQCGASGLRRNEGIVMPVYGTAPKPQPRLSTAG
jgi:hypothetical protein